MTVTTDISRISYAGDGTSVTFAFPYYFLAATDIRVFINFVEVTTGFTVSGAGSQSGGSVAFNTPPVAGAKILLVRDPDRLQQTALPPNDPFPSAAVERALDKLTMIAQGLKVDEARTVRFPLSESTDGQLPLASQRASMVYGFDATGTPTLLPMPSSLGAGDLRFDTFSSGAGFTPDVTTQLTLSRAPISKGNCWAYWDATPQLDFTVSGTTITFPTPIPSGIGKVYVRIGTTLAVSVPAQQSVTDSSVATGANINTDKLSYVPTWTGGVARTQAAKNADTVCVLDFAGVDPTGLTDSTAGMQAAHNTGRRVYYPAGNYLVLGTVTHTLGGMLGDGPDRTTITSGSVTADTIVWNGVGQVSYNATLAGPSYEGIGFAQSVTKTAGAFIKISPSVGEITFCKFLNLRFSGGYDQMIWNAVSHSIVDGCDFLNVTNNSLFVANTNHPDSGDSTVTNCTFNCGIPSGSRIGIYQQSSGGLRVVNNKFLGFNIHYFMGAVIATNVADLLIANNSFENSLQQSINLLRSSGAGNWGSINILCNQFGANPTNILTANATPFLSDMLIAGNTFGQLGASGIGISIANVNGFSIESNRLSGAGGTSSGISVAASCSNGSIDNNTFLSVAFPYGNSSTTTLIDRLQTASLNVTTGLAFGTLFSGSASITFPVPYPAGYIPQISASVTPGSASGVSAQWGNVTNTGFNLQVLGFTNGASVPVNWSAK